MYFSKQNFNINKNRLEITSRDNLVIVCIFSKNCQKCVSHKKKLDNFIKIFPSISFAILNLHNNDNEKINEILKSTDINLEYVPTYLLFKLGIFDRILNLEDLTYINLINQLNYELDPLYIKPKNSNKKKYITFKDF